MTSSFAISLLMCGLLSSASARPLAIDEDNNEIKILSYELPSQQGDRFPFGEQQGGRYSMPQQQGWRWELPTYKKMEKAFQIAKEQGLYYPFFKKQWFSREQSLPHHWSKQQGRSVPFVEEQGRRIQLPQEQKWQISFTKGQGKKSVPFAYEQDTSDEANKLSEELTKLLTDEKLSQQQGRYVPFGEEQGRRIQLPQEQNWQTIFNKGQGANPFAFGYKQDTSDEANKLSEEMENLLTNEKLSQQQGSFVPFGSWRIQLPQEQTWRIPFSKGQGKTPVHFAHKQDTSDEANKLSEELTKLLTDEKFSQQQGRSVPFGEEQGRRIQLPQEQNWQTIFNNKGQETKPFAFGYKQDTSDEVNKVSKEMATDEELSLQQGISVPFGEEQGRRIQLPQEQKWQISFTKGQGKKSVPFVHEQDTSDEANELSEELTKLLTDEKLSQQQGRSVPFGEEQGRRIQLPQEQNWQTIFSKGQGANPLAFGYKQDTSDEANKLSEELATDEELSQQQGISVPFGNWRIQLPQKQSWRIPFKSHEEQTSLHTDEK